MNRYRQTILKQVRELLAHRPAPRSILDFGCGDGWFAATLGQTWPETPLTAVDVKRRERSLVAPLIYDGRTLPFADRQFDLVYAIDVLHHCADPMASLHDVMRCSGRLLVIKDHVAFSGLDRLVLAVLDELGNRRFGIPSPYAYQHGWAWIEAIERAGFARRGWVHPARCHTGVLGAATNRLQFLGLWERN